VDSNQVVTIAIPLIIGTLIGFVISKLLSMKKMQKAESIINERNYHIDHISRDLFKAENCVEELRASLEIEKRCRIEAEAELNSLMKYHDESIKTVKEYQNELKDSFKSLSSSALSSSNDFLLKQSRALFQGFMDQTKSESEKREISIKSMLTPFNTLLNSYQSKMGEIETSRKEAYGYLKSQLDSLKESNENLQQETISLSNAFKNDKTRGRWGEITLKKVIEYTGLVEHCEFSEQKNLKSEDGKLFKPDMVVNLPESRTVIIDAKTPLASYLKACNTDDHSEKEKHMKEHAKALRQHIKALASKAYSNKLESAPEYVVMFLPAESFLTAAIQADSELLDASFKSNIILTSPITLIALLKTIAYTWRQYTLSENSREILKLGKSLYERIDILMSHLSATGTSLDKTVKSYNGAINSIESRVMPAIRKFHTLGVIDKTTPVKVPGKIVETEMVSFQ